MLEFEKKVMLTRQEYDCLRSVMGNKKSVLQTNYYFDTEDFAMNKKGITCRIRYKNGMYQTTIKNHNAQKLHCSEEYDVFGGEQFDPRLFLALGMPRQGELATERVILFQDELCEMVLDRNTYLDITDYELEMEYSEGYESKADRLLQEVLEILISYQVRPRGEKPIGSKEKSKSERFFDRKLKQGGEPYAIRP